MDEDAELIQKHLAGDRDASRVLVAKHQDAVFGLALRMLGSGEEARDAAQEVFLNVLEGLPGFRGESAFSTWLYRIAVNVCIARSKSRKRRCAAEFSLDEEGKQAVVPVDGNPSSQEILERDERDERLHRAIEELAEEYRAVITLHYLQGMAYEQIAQVLEIPMGTVKARLFRAKRGLRRRLHSWRKEIR